MNILTTIRDGLTGWTIRPPGASPEVVGQLSKESPVSLPGEYLSLLRFSNGGEGKLAVEPGWFVFWKAEDVIANNLGYHLPECLPGFFGFGSNGGGELLAFDTRSRKPWPVVMVPFNPLDAAESIVMAPNFTAFLKSLGHAQE